MKLVSAGERVTLKRRPFTGAWIETCVTRWGIIRKKSPLHGGVD